MDIILDQGKIYLCRDRFAEAVLIRDGRILMTGTSQEVRLAAGLSPRVIHCEGRTVIPGFNDSHIHFLQMGESRQQAQIGEARSIDQMIAICRTFIKAHPERTSQGLQAAGWNQDLFTDKRIPDRCDLDQIATDRPVILERVCGHILTVNSFALQELKRAGLWGQLNREDVMVDGEGEPTGVLAEAACNVVRELIPPFTESQKRAALQEAMAYALSKGLTSVQSNDVGTSTMDAEGTFSLLHSLYESGQGRIRYHHQVCFQDPADFRQYLTEGEFAKGHYPANSYLTLGPLKLFADGSLGARTALMKHGFADDPGNYGLDWMDLSVMEEFCQLAYGHGVQVTTHAIGDQAIENVIHCYEKAMAGRGNRYRFIINHCQITSQALLERIARAGLCVAAQPIFLDYDRTIVESRAGKELAKTSYAWKSLKDLGVHVSYGTDSPVEDCNPFPGIYAAVTRKGLDGTPEGGYQPQERVDIFDAVDAYTYESAYAQFQEGEKGRIQAGQVADLVMLEEDLFTCDLDAIPEIAPVLTMVGGKVEYEKR